VTKREKQEKLDRFYECLRTPVELNEPETAPFTLPEGVDPAPRRPLIDHDDFEIPRPTLTGMAGFASGWIAVALLIWVFYSILSI